MPDRRVVLVAVDGSEEADYALHWYMNNLYECEDRLVLAHAIQSCAHNDSWLLLASGKSAASIQVNDWDKISRGASERISKKINILMQKYEVDYRLRIKEGKPGPTILKIAEQEGAHLLLTGSKDVEKMRRKNSSNVTAYLMRKARMPLIVCRCQREGEINLDR